MPLPSYKAALSRMNQTSNAKPSGEIQDDELPSNAIEADMNPSMEGAADTEEVTPVTKAVHRQEVTTEEVNTEEVNPEVSAREEVNPQSEEDVEDAQKRAMHDQLDQMASRFLRHAERGRRCVCLKGAAWRREETQFKIDHNHDYLHIGHAEFPMSSIHDIFCLGDEIHHKFSDALTDKLKDEEKERMVMMVTHGSTDNVDDFKKFCLLMKSPHEATECVHSFRLLSSYAKSARDLKSDLSTMGCIHEPESRSTKDHFERGQRDMTHHHYMDRFVSSRSIVPEDKSQVQLGQEDLFADKQEVLTTRSNISKARKSAGDEGLQNDYFEIEDNQIVELVREVKKSLDDPADTESLAGKESPASSAGSPKDARLKAAPTKAVISPRSPRAYDGMNMEDEEFAFDSPHGDGKAKADAGQEGPDEALPTFAGFMEDIKNNKSARKNCYRNCCGR